MHPDDTALPREVAFAVGNDPYLTVLSQILDKLSEGRFLPTLRTAYFSLAASITTVQVIPPQLGSTFVTLFNASADALTVARWEQGTTAADSEPFPFWAAATGRLPGSFYVPAFNNYNMSVSRPNYIFRTDPEKGVFLNQLGGPANLTGWISFFTAEVDGSPI